MGKIVSKPEAGWASLDLKEYKGSLSYIDDIPNMLCNLIEQYMLTHNSVCSFDCEGYTFSLVLSMCSIDILEFSESECPTLVHSRMDPEQFCKQVIEDLSEDILEWADTYYDKQTELDEWESYYEQVKETLNGCRSIFFEDLAN